MKKILFQVHLWGGLTLGVYAFLIGLTGAVLVFREEIVRVMAPAPRVDESQPASIEAIRAGIQSAYPEWHAWSLEAPREAGAPWSSYLLQRGKGRLVFADAAGRVVGERSLEGTWLAVFERFHSNLFLPRGRLWNGIAGLLLLAIAGTGIYLWWPRAGAWNTAFVIVRRSNWKGIVYDLHRVGGAITVGFFILFCITGAYFTWPAVYRDIAGAILPVKPKPQPVSIRTEGARQPIDDLVAAAQRAAPEGRLMRVLVPQGRREPVRVFLAFGAPVGERNVVQLAMHPHTGEVLSVDDFRERRIGDHAVSWIGPLHTGHFGGVAIKTIWALAGLAMPALLITGFIMWTNRVLAPKLRRRPR